MKVAREHLSFMVCNLLEYANDSTLYYYVYLILHFVFICRARLEELKIFLETEAWELCPVRSTFSLHQLRVR